MEEKLRIQFEKCAGTFSKLKKTGKFKKNEQQSQENYRKIGKLKKISENWDKMFQQKKTTEQRKELQNNKIKCST